MVANIDLCGYEAPTPVQAYAIPAVLTGNDVIGVAQTGMLSPLRFQIRLKVVFRFRKDGSVPYPDNFSTHWQNQEARSASTQLGKRLQPRY